MARALEAAGAHVTPFDIADYGYGGVRDFLRDEFPEQFDGTITNPPYGPRGKTAEAFIETGLRRLGNGFLALLLPADFDSAGREEGSSMSARPSPRRSYSRGGLSGLKIPPIQK